MMCGEALALSTECHYEYCSHSAVSEMPDWLLFQGYYRCAARNNSSPAAKPVEYRKKETLTARSLC